MALTHDESAIVMGTKDGIKNVKAKLAQIFRATGLDEVENARKELDAVEQMVTRLITETPQPARAVPWIPTLNK